MEAMPRRAIRSRFLAWTFRVLVAAALVAGWKAAWWYGPRLLAPAGATSPALFPLPARLILTAGMDYPHRLEATVPFPAPGSNAGIQLKLMGLLDGAGWTMKALQVGRVAGKDLKVRAGILALHSVGAVGPLRQVDGLDTCLVEYRVRWELPDADRELWAVKHLVDLRPPKGLEGGAPGQEVRRQATLVRRPGRWTCAASGPAQHPGGPSGGTWRAWAGWLF